MNRTAIAKLLVVLAAFVAVSSVSAQNRPGGAGTPPRPQPYNPPRNPTEPSGPGRGVAPNGGTSKDEAERQRRRDRLEDEDEARKAGGNGAGAGNPAGGAGPAGAGAAAKAPPSSAVVKAAQKQFQSWRAAAKLRNDGRLDGTVNLLDKRGRMRSTEFTIVWKKDAAGYRIFMTTSRDGDLPPEGAVGSGASLGSLEWHVYAPEEKKLLGPRGEAPRFFVDAGLTLRDFIPFDASDLECTEVVEQTTDAEGRSVYVLDAAKPGVAPGYRIRLRRETPIVDRIEILDPASQRLWEASEIGALGVHRLWSKWTVQSDVSGTRARISLKSQKVNAAPAAELFDPKRLAENLSDIGRPAPRPAKAK